MLIQSALSKTEKDSELLFYKGIMKLSKQQYIESFQEFSNVNLQFIYLDH